MTKLKNMKRWIVHRKNRIQTGLQVNTNEIYIQKFPVRYYLYSSVESENEEDNYRKTNELITRFMENNPAFKSDYEVAYIQHGKDVEYGFITDMTMQLSYWINVHRNSPITYFQKVNILLHITQETGKILERLTSG